ncbi:MAG: hypothetical protein ACREAU_00425 [Nitrosopumilaceae archaeon]
MNPQKDSYFTETIRPDQYCLWNKTTNTVIGAFGKLPGAYLSWVFYAYRPSLGQVKGCVRLRAEACRVLIALSRE